jgi:hypothetical protein
MPPPQNSHTKAWYRNEKPKRQPFHKRIDERYSLDLTKKKISWENKSFGQHRKYECTALQGCGLFMSFQLRCNANVPSLIIYFIRKLKVKWILSSECSEIICNIQWESKVVHYFFFFKLGKWLTESIWLWKGFVA